MAGIVISVVETRFIASSYNAYNYVNIIYINKNTDNGGE